MELIDLPDDISKRLNDNKLISKFIGLNVYYKQCNHYQDPIEYEMVIDNGEFLDHDVDLMYLYEIDEPNIESHFKFDSDWNWLMPVVEKIEELDYLVSICSDICTITYAKQPTIGGGGKLDATYRSVIKFIKWYNEKT